MTRSEDREANAMASEHHILLSDPAWAGPTAYRTSGIDTIMNLGRRLETDPGAFAFELRVDSKALDPAAFAPLDWHDPRGGQPLFSERMATVLEQAGVANIDYYPVRVRYQPTGAEVNYRLANVIGLISALDTAASEVSADDDGFIFDIASMRLDPSKCRGLDLFRLKEMPNLMIVSLALKRVLEGSGLTGFRVIEDHEWQPGMI